MKRAVWVTTLVTVSILLCVRPCTADTEARHPIQWWSLVATGEGYVGTLRAKMSHTSRSLALRVPSYAPWMGQKLEIAILARNRGSTSFLLGNDARSAVDFAKVSRSTRMLVDRLTLSGGRVQPFAQVGAGQWRKDIDKRLVGDLWYGVFYGSGVQVRLSDGWALGIEADQLFLRNPLAHFKGQTLSVQTGFVGIEVALP